MESTDRTEPKDALTQLLEQMITRQCGTLLSEASDNIARTIATLRPEASEKEIAEEIDVFLAKIRDVLPNMILQYQRIIRDMAAKRAATLKKGG